MYKRQIYRKSDPTTEYNYFEDDLPIYKVEDWVNAAVEKGYDTLYNEHVADYKKLYDRCSINIGAVEAVSYTHLIMPTSIGAR